MPNPRRARSLLARTLRRRGRHCVWRHPYEPPLGQKLLGQGISQTERAISFHGSVLKVEMTILDQQSKGISIDE
jgi:hypothetical protein